VKKKIICDLINSRKRMLIAFDKEGIHFRETLCVTHDGPSGESRYDTKPVGSLRFPRQLRKILANFIAVWS
jgi:hypothetical protein